MNPHADRDRSERPYDVWDKFDRLEAEAKLAEQDASWKAFHDDQIAQRDAELAEKDATIARLEAEVERWTEKAQESGAAYANANTKHHAEWDRANRLERLADTLAEKAVDLEDRARKAEAVLARVRAAREKARNAAPEEGARGFSRRDLFAGVRITREFIDELDAILDGTDA